MATKTTKRTTAARKPAAKKVAAPQSKVAKVLDKGTATDYKTKYHFMCVVSLIFAVICCVLFMGIFKKQMDYDDLQNCYADDTNCTLPNKRASHQEKEETSYYNGDTVEENAVSAAGQE